MLRDLTHWFAMTIPDSSSCLEHSNMIFQHIREAKGEPESLCTGWILLMSLKMEAKILARYQIEYGRWQTNIMKQSLQNLQCVTNIQNGRVWEKRIITGHMLCTIFIRSNTQSERQTERSHRKAPVPQVGVVRMTQWANSRNWRIDRTHCSDRVTAIYYVSFVTLLLYQVEVRYNYSDGGKEMETWL